MHDAEQNLVQGSTGLGWIYRCPDCGGIALSVEEFGDEGWWCNDERPLHAAPEKVEIVRQAELTRLREGLAEAREALGRIARVEFAAESGLGRPTAPEIAREAIEKVDFDA